MKRKNNTRVLLTAACLAVSLLTASAQEKKHGIDWMQELKDRITLNGYAQAGYAYTDQEGASPKSSYNLKRTLLWAKARITDRWSFLFMHDFNSQVQEFYTDFRVKKSRGIYRRLSC